jgi:hypothetical protein
VNRLLIVSAVAAAGCVAAVPAVAGLAGNPSFSHQVPVRVPSQAQVVQFDGHGTVVGLAAATSSSPTSRHAEPGDDRGGLRTTTSVQPTDDNDVDSPAATSTTSPEPEPGDDRGADDSPTARPTSEPSDENHRGSSSSPATSTSGGSGGGTSGGSDDHGGTSPAPTGTDDHGHGG